MIWSGSIKVVANIYEVVPNLKGKSGYPLYFPVSQSILDNNSLIKQTEGY
jgi:hypothetical protein